jgi:hypothetical protein
MTCLALRFLQWKRCSGDRFCEWAAKLLSVLAARDFPPSQATIPPCAPLGNISAWKEVREIVLV